METTNNLRFGIGIAVHNLITEDELKPIVTELKEKGIELEYNYFTRGAQASLDWLNPVVALYGDSEMFRSLIQNGAYDAFKFYLLTIFNTVAGRTYYKITSRTQEEKKGTIAIIVNTNDKASVTYNFEGVVSETDIKNSFDAFIKSVETIQPDANKRNMAHAKFNIETNEWTVKTMNELIQDIRDEKAKSVTKK
ncbi:MAG: hypothetical protein KIS69_11390 [Bacteroidetes bacterium]|nr:hypothetical protein [Bacteroidota bacterium]